MGRVISGVQCGRIVECSVVVPPCEVDRGTANGQVTGVAATAAERADRVPVRTSGTPHAPITATGTRILPGTVPDIHHLIGILTNRDRVGRPISDGRNPVPIIPLVENCDDGPYFFVCSCCPCCCIGLRGLLELGNPRAVAPSNYIAVVNEDCTGCGYCVDRCHFNAIKIKNEKAVVDKNKCMGCSVCAVNCPFINMERIEREKVPKNLLSLYGEIAEEKGRSFF